MTSETTETTETMISSDELRRLRERIAAMDRTLAEPDAVDRGVAEDVEFLEQLRALQAALGASMARASLRIGKQRVVEAREQGASLEGQRASVVGELALAHRVSPAVMTRRVEDYRRLVQELPAVRGLLEAGEISERVALVVADGARGLDADQAAALDGELAPDLPGLSPRQATARVRAFCLRVDPETQARKAQLAAGGANVSCRPVADGMARVSILAPTVEAVGMYASIRRTAETTRQPGQSLGQAMVQVAFQRLTGRADATELPLEVQLVISDSTLLDPTSTEPARLTGGTGITDAWLPAPLARRLAVELPDESNADNGADENGDSADGNGADGNGRGKDDVAHDTSVAGAPRWLRRLFTDPATGTLTGIDTRRRLFTPAQRRFIASRDQACTTPYCDAPIRHIDHAVPHAQGGPTDVLNGNGKCQRCNQHKDHPGWATDPEAAAPRIPHRITVTTPTGRRYSSTSPPVLGPARPESVRSIPDASIPAPATPSTPSTLDGRWPLRAPGRLDVIWTTDITIAA